MSDPSHPAAAQPEPGGFSLARTLAAVAISIVVNAVLPFVIYRTLAPHYPSDSLAPLLASTVFPLVALGIGLLRRRADTIAIISLVEIAISIVVTLIAADVRLALIARALQGTLTGLFFLATTWVKRPLLYYVARQFVTANSPAVIHGFDECNRIDRGRTFARLTVVWAVGTIIVSLVNLALAERADPATYLLVAPIFGIACNVAMIAFTIRYASTRFRRIAAERSATPATAP